MFNVYVHRKLKKGGLNDIKDSRKERRAAIRDRKFLYSI